MKPAVAARPSELVDNLPLPLIGIRASGQADGDWHGLVVVDRGEEGVALVLVALDAERGRTIQTGSGRNLVWRLRAP